MFAFKIAGSSKPWIPKPVKCVTFASPINGSSGFRTAFEVRQCISIPLKLGKNAGVVVVARVSL